MKINYLCIKSIASLRVAAKPCPSPQNRDSNTSQTSDHVGDNTTFGSSSSYSSKRVVFISSRCMRCKSLASRCWPIPSLKFTLQADRSRSPKETQKEMCCTSYYIWSSHIRDGNRLSTPQHSREVCQYSRTQRLRTYLQGSVLDPTQLHRWSLSDPSATPDWVAPPNSAVCQARRTQSYPPRCYPSEASGWIHPHP